MMRPGTLKPWAVFPYSPATISTKSSNITANLVRIIAGMGLKNLELRNGASERNQAEEALLLSRFCIDKAGIGIYHTDENGTIFSVNDYACASLGYSKEELCALTLFDIDPAITREKMLEIKKIMDISGAATFETIHRRKDGTTFPVEITVNLLEFNGKTFGISFVKDITERKRAEEALRASEAEKALILNSTMDYVMYHDPDMQIVWANRNAGKLAKLPVEDLIGRHCWKVVHKRDIPCEDCPVILARDTGEPQKIEKRHINGLTLIMRAYPIKNDQGRLMGIAEFVSDITERKQAEEALRKSRQMLMSVLDNFPGVVFWKDRNSVYMGCNKNFSLAAGLSEPSEIVGKNDHELPWKNDAEWYLADDRQVIESGVPKLNIIETLLHADGRVAWFETSKVPLFDADGKVFAVLGSSNDITERKRMEEELLCSEKKYRSIVDAYDGLIYICSQDYRIEFMNQKLIERTGYSAVGELCYRVLHDRDSVCPWCVNGRVCAGETVHWEILSPKDGRWYYVVNVPIYNANGTVSKHSVIADITERKLAEESLKRAKEEWERTFASVPDLIAILDNRHRVLRVNEAMAKRLGLKPDDYIGRPCYEAIHGLSDPHPFCPHTQTLKDGRKHVVEIHEERLGGDFLVSTTPLNDERGVMIGSVHIAYDITERKRAEEALRKAYDELESRVSERTSQLTSLTAELSLAEERERRRIATELHDQVGQTLILSKIKLDSLSRSLPSESFGKQIGEISKYLDQSIQEIRSLTFQLSPPLLYEVGFEAAVEWLGEEFEEKYGLQMEFRDDGKKKPLAEEASVALFQMVRELLLNVAKHAKAKKVWISIGKASGKIKINVADDGSGFDCLNGMRRKNKKSGFGLFNIRHRIEYLGGDLTIESDIGCGTRATLSLPLKKKEPNGKIS